MMILTLGPSLKTKEGLLVYPFKWRRHDLGTNFLTEASGKVGQDAVFPWLQNVPTLSSAGKVSRVR